MTLNERRAYNAGYRAGLLESKKVAKRRGLNEARSITLDTFLDVYGDDIFQEAEAYDFVSWAADQGYTEDARLPVSEWNDLTTEYFDESGR